MERPLPPTLRHAGPGRGLTWSGLGLIAGMLIAGATIISTLPSFFIPSLAIYQIALEKWTGQQRVTADGSARRPGSAFTGDSLIPFIGPRRDTYGLTEAVKERPDRGHGDALHDRLVQPMARVPRRRPEHPGETYDDLRFVLRRR